jgi:hypothetical protein
LTNQLEVLHRQVRDVERLLPLQVDIVCTPQL